MLALVLQSAQGAVHGGEEQSESFVGKVDAAGQVEVLEAAEAVAHLVLHALLHVPPVDELESGVADSEWVSVRRSSPSFLKPRNPDG